MIVLGVRELYPSLSRAREGSWVRHCVSELSLKVRAARESVEARGSGMQEGGVELPDGTRG